MRLFGIFALAAGLVAAGCGSDGDTELRPSNAGTYPGDLRAQGCADHWYTGSDGTARFSCAPTGYRIAFTQSGQDTSLTQIAPAAVMRVDAVVRATTLGHPHPIIDPGIGCFRNAKHGWLAQLGTKSAFVIVAYGSYTPLASGHSPAIHPLARPNHLVMTCDASGSRTRITLSVNGTRVAHDVDAQNPVRFNRFGMWAAGEVGAAVEFSVITATTRSGADSVGSSGQA